MPNKKHRLQRVACIGFAIYALVLVLGIGAVVVTQNIISKTKDNHETAFGYTRAAAKFIDGDTIEKYLTTGEKDAYYTEIENYLCANVQNSNLIGLYLAVPRENDIVCLWDAEKGEKKTVPLGTSISYSEYADGTKEFLESVLSNNPPEKIITGHEDGLYIATAISPIFNSAGEPVAVVAADLSMPDIQKEITSAWLTVILAIIGIVLLSVLSFFAIARKLVIIPIQKLDDAAQNLVHHLEREEAPKLDIKTGNEIEDLADSFLQMYDEVREYIAKLSAITAEKERIGAELDVATHIQKSMLPCIFPAFPDRREIDIYATMDPAKEVGGDFYDFFMVDERHLAIVVADVSGKGVPAALFMVIGKTLIKDHTKPGRDLGEVFGEVNDLLCVSNSEGMFITAFEGVLDLATGRFDFVNAGHEMPFLCKAGENYHPYKIRPGFVLAGMEGMRFQAGSLCLAPGDRIFQYTDGVTEATNVQNELYGMDRLETALNRDVGLKPTELLPAVKADIDAFAGEAPQFDDITMLCMEFKEKMAPEGNAVCQK